MTIDLLPCPFCGGAALFGACGHAEDDDNAGSEYISCTKCDATTALVYPCMDEVKSLLAERWNRRFAAAPQGGDTGAPS